jgi:hypothetical protein
MLDELVARMVALGVHEGLEGSLDGNLDAASVTSISQQQQHQPPAAQ